MKMKRFSCIGVTIFLVFAFVSPLYLLIEKVEEKKGRLDSDYFLQRYRSLASKYAYLKKKNEHLYEKIARYRQILTKFEKVFLEGMEKREGIERLAPLYLGNIEAVGERLLSRKRHCEEAKELLSVEREVLGYDSDALLKHLQKCEDEKEERLEEWRMEIARIWGMHEFDGEEKAIWWKARINHAMERFGALGSREKAFLLDLYRGALEDCNGSREFTESVQEGIEYWELYYGLRPFEGSNLRLSEF